MSEWTRICISGLLVLALSACGGGTGEEDAAETRAVAGIDADIGKAVVTLIRAFELPDGVANAVLLGEGLVALDTTDHDGDADSLWVETLDINENGNMNETQLLWDDEDNILYAYAFEKFDCLRGDGTADGGMLAAIYGEENTRGAPPGSGFYVVGLDAGECFARTAMLWGCEFDETGAKSKCGEATIDPATGTLEITTIQPID